MKRIIKSLMCAVVAMTALVSCQKEKFSEITSVSGEKIEVSLAGSIGDFVQVDDTKAAAQSVVRVTWAQDDKVYVYDGSECLGTLTVTPDTKNASYALLSGTITASKTTPTKLTLVYSNTATEAPAISEGKVSIDLSNQSEADVPFVLYATIDYDTAKLERTEEYIPFSFATSVMTVNVTDLPTGTENAKIDITKAKIDAVSTVCELTISASEEPTVAGASKGVITRSAGFAQSDSRGTFTVAVAAETAAQSARTILVYQEAKVSGAPFATTTIFAENKSYNTVCQLSEYVQSVPDGMLPGEFTVSADGKKVHFSQGNLYYDGSNWGFEEEQYYFRTYEGFGKCDKDGYKNSGTASGHWGLFGWVGASSTKFTTSPEIYGVSTSENKGDYGAVSGEALKADWGKAIDDNGTWKTLSGGDDGEWKYLFDHHVSLWGTCNGVPGLFIAPDGFEGDAITLLSAVSDWGSAEAAGIVFLPAAGIRSGSSSIDFFGSYGNYWSSTNDKTKGVPYRVLFNNNINFSTASRPDGSSVRLVTESGYAPAVKVTGISLASSKDTVEVGASKALVATVTPSNAAHQEIIWSSSDPTVATVDENGEVTGVAEGQAIITATTVDGNFSASSLVTVEAPSGPEYVVMNMGTGEQAYTLKWTTMNLGATGVTEFGEYYQWGGIVGHKALGNTIGSTFENDFSFDWSTAPLNGDKATYSSTEFYKIKPQACPDNILTSAYDAASQVLGGIWRMPTTQEFKDLYDACGGTCDLTTYKNTDCGKSTSFSQGVYLCGSYDGVPGCLFCDKDGNTLFFPSTGCGQGTTLSNPLTDGYYWSSTLCDEYTPYFLFFGKNSNLLPQATTGMMRNNGCTIRPVADVEK